MTGPLCPWSSNMKGEAVKNERATISTLQDWCFPQYEMGEASLRLSSLWYTRTFFGEQVNWPKQFFLWGKGLAKSHKFHHYMFQSFVLLERKLQTESDKLRKKEDFSKRGELGGVLGGAPRAFHLKVPEGGPFVARLRPAWRAICSQHDYVDCWWSGLFVIWLYFEFLYHFNISVYSIMRTNCLMTIL